MFYYYGGKKRLAPKYPAPRYLTVYEPFAGAAGYGMHHLDRVNQVVLVENDDRVVDAWETILNATQKQLREYPLPRAGERTNDFLYMTMAASSGIARSNWMHATERMEGVARSMLNRIADDLKRIQEKVTIFRGDYRQLGKRPATWFVDPPYAVNERAASGSGSPQGMGYAPGSSSEDIDYAELARWCRSRPGQVIVCEQEGATWLPFEFLAESGDSQGRKAREVVWVR